MDYDIELWDEYTNENESSLENPSQFIYHVALSLGAKSILEAGCNVGNNLKNFPNCLNVNGFDLNTHAINKCKKNYPDFNFKVGSIMNIPYPNSTFDLVFTRTVLIHIPDSEMDKAMKELLRVSKRWIVNIEFFGEKEEMIDWKRGANLLWYRNMAKRWKKFNTRILSDVELPMDLDPNNVRFTLVEKLEI